MFNLSQFSSTPFSGVGKNGIPIYCTASMRMTVSGSFNVFRAVTAVALFRAEAYGQMICIRPAAGEASLHMCTEGACIRIKFLTSSVNMLMLASALGYRTYGTKELEFENIELKAGDEVIINTDDMTVTINGQNATVFLSADSDFFKLKPGENIISISGSDGAVGDAYIIWKDRWL